MTGDEFTAKYRLRAQLNDGDIVSYRAADGRGGYALVHVFRGEDALEFDEETLGPRGREELREVLEVEGIRVVVTEVVDPFSSFDAWYEDRQGESEKEEPGAFTRIFRVEPEPEPDDVDEAPGPTLGTSPPPVPPPAEPTPTEPTPTEPAPTEPAPTEPATRDAALAEEGAQPPGEFTRLFGSQEKPPPAPPGAGPTDPTLVRPAAERPLQAPPPPPPPPTAGEAALPPRPPEPPEPPAGPGKGPSTGTFTRIMSGLGSRGGDAPPPRPGRSSEAPPPPPPQPGGWQPSGTPPPPPQPPAAQPPPQPPKSPLAKPSASQPAVSPPPPSAPPPPPLAAPPPPPARESGGAPGPYTLAMRAYRGSGQPNPPPTPADSQAGGLGMEEYGPDSGGYLDRLQERGDTAATQAPGGLVPPPPNPRSQQPPVPSGPSDYTRVIRGAGPPPMGGKAGADIPAPYGGPPQPSGPSPSKPAAAAPSKTPIVIGLVVTVAVLVAIVLFFALRG